MTTKREPIGSRTDYGNTFRVMKGVFVTGIGCGLFAVAAGLAGRHFALFPGPANSNAVVGLLVGPLFIMFVAILPTVLFQIRLSEGRVQNVFAGRYIISDLPVSELVGIRRNSRCCAVVLCFTGDQHIHFLGATSGEIARLVKDLAQAKAASINDPAFQGPADNSPSTGTFL